ncbi:MAG: hypothetical protein JXA19_00715 [Anaerolineales bacterium]|nr:hypothetical protein [Anaerolineales bacterium]
MIIALYHQDSFIQSLPAKVTSLDESLPGIELNQTVFFPGDGGQHHNGGRCICSEGRNIDIISMKRVNGKLWLICTEVTDPPEAGEAVSDGKRRYKLRGLILPCISSLE